MLGISIVVVKEVVGLVDLPFGKSSFVGLDWIWLSLGGSASVLWWPLTEVMGVFRIQRGIYQSLS
jgi:hypothetical protein